MHYHLKPLPGIFHPWPLLTSIHYTPPLHRRSQCLLSSSNHKNQPTQPNCPTPCPTPSILDTPLHPALTLDYAPNQVVRSSVEGTRNVVESAAKNGVSSVVVTSSMAAVRGPADAPRSLRAHSYSCADLNLAIGLFFHRSLSTLERQICKPCV